MCKLCNTDNPSVNVRTTDNVVAQTVKEYIGEFPCKKALKVLKQDIKRQPNKDIDHQIMQYMYKKYRLFNSAQLGNSKSKYNTAKKAKYLGSVSGIGMYQTVNQEIRYKAYLENRKQLIFFTFQEALQAKVDYYIKTNNKKSIVKLQTKLKELENGPNNIKTS